MFRIECIQRMDEPKTEASKLGISGFLTDRLATYRDCAFLLCPPQVKCVLYLRMMTAYRKIFQFRVTLSYLSPPPVSHRNTIMRVQHLAGPSQNIIGEGRERILCNWKQNKFRIRLSYKILDNRWSWQSHRNTFVKSFLTNSFAIRRCVYCCH